MSEKTGATPVFEGPESAAELLARVRKRLAAAPPAPAGSRLPVDPEFDLSRSEGLLDGWYEPDLWGERMTRWVARRFDFEAQVGSATHVAIDALLFDTSGLAQLRGRIRANDVVGAAFRAMPGWNAIRVPIPAGVSGRVHFSVDALMNQLGYDKTDVSQDLSTPQGVGNVAAQAVLDFCHHDGSNQLGDLNTGAYSDYTGYQ